MSLLDLETLSTATSPEELITASLWRKWTDRIDAHTLARSVVELAVKTQTNLPPGEWGPLTQYLSEFPFTNIPREKRKVLILIVAKLVQDNATRRPQELVDAPSIGRLMRLMDIKQLVSETSVVWSAWCRRLQTCGSKDRLVGEIAEELGLSWPFSRRAEPLETYLDLMPVQIGAIPGIGRKKLRTILLCVAQAFYDSGSRSEATCHDESGGQRNAAEDSNDLSPSYRPIQVVLEELLNCLKKSSRDIVASRFGLYGRHPQTLAAIAELHGVTRQRISQIEAKALTVLANSPLSPELRLGLRKEADFIWNDVAAGNEVILSGTPDAELRRRLSPTYRLSFAICNLSVSAFLDEIAIRLPQGWYRTATDRFLIERVIFQLDNDAGGPYPIPIEVVARRLDAAVSAVRLAVSLSTTTKVYKGYVWKGPLGKRIQRSIALHRILASMSNRIAVETTDLVSIHNRMCPHSTCSYRDVEMAMARFGHLFVQMGKGAWTAAGGVALPSIVEVDSATRRPRDQDDLIIDICPNTAEGAIAKILTEFGPLSMSEIITQFRILTDFRASSVGPILLTRGKFVRLAPGIYGLTQHLGDKVAFEKARRLLLTDTACARYIRALRAGEPRDKFPLWTHRMEHEWCEWAKHSAKSRIYSSLLVVVQPDQWHHVPAEEREKWKKIKQADCCYQIDDEVRLALSSESVFFKDLLNPIIVASRRGHLGWVTINHLHGKRQNDKQALTYLGLLVAAGVVDTQDDWRLPHNATDEADGLCDNLLEALYQEGRVRWDSRMGTLFKERIKTGLRQSQGWTTEEINRGLRRVIPTSEENRRTTAEAMIQARVELGIAIASVDGKMDEHELDRVRGHALVGVRDLGRNGASLVENIVQETLSSTPDALAVAKKIRKTMPTAKRQSLMKYLFMIAAEDGVFHEAEGRLLILLQKALDIDPDHFETLYRSHAKDPRAAALLAEKLRRRQSHENVDELVSLLLL